jgi:hypothetical protein
MGGGVPAWLRAVLEGRAMGLTEKELQPASKELTKALSAAPTSGEIVAALSALNRREFRDDKRLSAEGLKTIRRWLAKGAACPLSPAEFQTVAETFEKFEVYDLLGDYAKAAASRDPGEPLYEFYRIFARVSGKSIWLKIPDTEMLEKVIEWAGERKDVKLVHRVVNFIEEGMPSVPFYEEEFDDPFGGLPPGVPLDVLRDIEAAGARALELLETHSRQETVDIMVREFGNSAMAKQLPKGILKKLFNTLVDEAAGLPEFPPLPRKRRDGRARR